MRISKANLKLIIENYLIEQDDEQTQNVEADNVEADQEATDDKADSSDDLDIDWDKSKFKVELDGEEYEVQPYLDVDDEVKYKVDNEPRNNKTKLNFFTIGGLATLSDDPIVRKAGEALVKIDTNLKNKSIETIRQIIKQRMSTERQGFSIEDIRKAIKP